MSRIRLTSGTGAAAEARSAVRDAFFGKFSERAVADAALVASELVSALRGGMAEMLTVNPHNGDGRLHVDIEGKLFMSPPHRRGDVRVLILDAITDDWGIEDRDGDVFAWGVVSD